MRVKPLLIATIGLALTLPVIASAQFADNFDSYPTGQDLDGLNGWQGWDNNPAATAFTSADQSQSAPNSVEIGPTSDLVNRLGNPTSGAWVVSVDQYIPSGSTGEQHFLLLNEYNDGGPYNWSTSVRFLDGVVINDGDGTTTSVIADTWVEIRVEIDLAANVQSIYYNGDLLGVASWTEGITGGGVPEIGCVDLFSDAASEIYYDNFVLEPFTPTPVLDRSWGEIKATFKN